MNQRHLSDDRLIELSLGLAAGGDDAHVATCEACRLRRASLEQLLAEIDATASSEADAAFPADRLARQQARILHRLEQEGRPGRVIAFPASQPQEFTSLRTRPLSRWVAAAAVAGLVVGLLAGHLAHDLPLGSAERVPQMVANESGDDATLRAVSTTMSDDEFLGEVELSVGSTGSASLRPLDALTPRAWEVR